MFIPFDSRLLSFFRQFFALSQAHFASGNPDKDMTLHNITWVEDDHSGETCREMEISKYAAFILHNTKDAAKLLFQKCKNLIKRIRPALIVTPEIITTDLNYLKFYPEGLLAVRRKPQSNYEQAGFPENKLTMTN